MLYLLIKQNKDIFFCLPSGDRGYWAGSIRYVIRDHRMRDRFQFYPNYDFFNFFKPQGFISFGFKHFDKKVVSYVASKQDLPIVLETLGNRPALLRLLANLAPEAKLA